MRRTFLPTAILLWVSFIVFHQKFLTLIHKYPQIYSNMQVYSKRTHKYPPHHTHTHLHLLIFAYACKFQTAAFLFLYPLCTHRHPARNRHVFLSLFLLFFLILFFLLFFWFCDVAFPVAWCHSESTRAARRQVNSNWSKCTCGLSSSQSLGKYPINNPVTTTPVTPTHMGS